MYSVRSLLLMGEWNLENLALDSFDLAVDAVGVVYVLDLLQDKDVCRAERSREWYLCQEIRSHREMHIRIAR